MKLLQRYFALFVFVFAGSLMPNFTPSAMANDPYQELAEAILKAAGEVSTSVDGLSQTISIDAGTLFDLIRMYAPAFNQSVRLVSESAQVFNHYFPEMVQGVNQVGVAAESASQYLPSFNDSSQSLAASLHLIAENIDYFSSLVKDSQTQIMIAIPVVIVSTAAVFYIGDCTIKILKTIYGWSKSFYGWCRKNPEHDFIYTSEDLSSFLEIRATDLKTNGFSSAFASV
jgi:hypothetical protein